MVQKLEHLSSQKKASVKNCMWQASKLLHGLLVSIEVGHAAVTLHQNGVSLLLVRNIQSIFQLH